MIKEVPQHTKDKHFKILFLLRYIKNNMHIDLSPSYNFYPSTHHVELQLKPRFGYITEYEDPEFKQIMTKFLEKIGQPHLIDELKHLPNENIC